ncbi:hypothetical protein CBL_01576 [Carabus blaptoides fortunei]
MLPTNQKHSAYTSSYLYVYTSIRTTNYAGQWKLIAYGRRLSLRFSNIYISESTHTRHRPTCSQREIVLCPLPTAVYNQQTGYNVFSTAFVSARPSPRRQASRPWSLTNKTLHIVAPLSFYTISSIMSAALICFFTISGHQV